MFGSLIATVGLLYALASGGVPSAGLPLVTDSYVPAIVAAKALVVALGATITYYAARAARRTGSTALRHLAVGFGIVTVGGAVGGVVDRLLGMSLEAGVLAQTLVTAVGFAVVLRSLYVPGSDEDAPRLQEDAGPNRRDT